MKNSQCKEDQLGKTKAGRKASLEAELEQEQRTSRRQVLLKALWKLDQQKNPLEKEPATSNR